MAGLLSGSLMGPAQRLGAGAAPMAQQASAAPGGGLLAMFSPQAAASPLYAAFDQRRNVLANMLLGGVGAESPLERMRGMAQGALKGREADSAYATEMKKQAQQQNQVNQTLKLLTERRPDLVPWVQSGAITPADAFNAVYKKDGKATDDITEYQYAVQQGYKGNFQNYMTEMKKAGATNVTVGDGAPGLGKLSSDYGYVMDPQTRQPVIDPNTGLPRAAAIPGSPAAAAEQASAGKTNTKTGQAEVATRVVTSAAQRAREAAKNRNFGPYGQSVTQNLPWTDSAEVSRQVDVLKSQATIENLNAMRAQSPTGGALGNVTEGEGKMLAAKSGALDPSSPNFQRDLDDYELTLLQVVHGPLEGTRIFKESRADATAQPAAPAGTSTGVQWSIEP